MTDLKQAVYQLMNAIHDLRLEGSESTLREALANTRAVLAQPEPEGPTDEEIYKLALEGDFLVDAGDGFSCMVQDEVEFARAVLARWGNL